MKSDELLKIFSHMSGMASLARFSMVRMHNKESVLEHTGFVVMFCYFFYQSLTENQREGIDLGMLLSKAVVHDLDEIVTGDVSRPTKYFSSAMRDEFTRLEEVGINRISQQLGMPQIVIDHANSKYGETGMIVLVSDLVAVVYKIWDEVLLQNNFLMVRQAIGVKRYLVNLELKLASSQYDIAEPLLELLPSLFTIINSAIACDRPILGTIDEGTLTNEN